MNEHITKNLQHYLSIENPQYAVLLSGKWGCGKTFFIDEFVKGKKNKDKKFIKVSLFGLKDISEVNNKIILQLLNIKKKWFGNIAKAVQSYTKKLNLPIQDLPIDKIFDKLGKELVFIFDDLERIDESIKYSEILGYINYFVEQSNFKVIILANEAEIKDEKFTEFKEKVIGKTFEVQQDFNTVFDVFLKLELELDTDTKDALTKNKQSIKDVYDKAGYNNLRHIRQIILDFDYFYQSIDAKFRKNNDFLKELICLFFAFSIEVKKGQLKADGISKYISTIFNKDQEETNCKDILDKYSLSNDNNLIDIFGGVSFLIGTENWEKILFKGSIAKDDINAVISKTSYFAKDSRELWVKLWYFRDLEENEFKTILADVLKKFNNNEYKEREELLHVVAILLFFSKQGLYNTEQTNILTQAKKNIDANAKTLSWQQNEYKHDSSNSVYSLGYMDEKSEQFREIIKYLTEKSQKAFNIGLKAKANTLLQDFKNNDIEALKAKLVLRDLNNIAIFSQINVEDFIEILLKVRHTYLRRMFSILKKRYQDNTKLTQDLKFWQNVNKNLLDKINKDKQPLKYFRMTKFKDYTLKEIITALKPKVSE